MLAKIREQLAALEEANAVKILYACESGSRAWGFASTDSDFDVRFIYIRHPSTYLSIKEYKDYLDLPADEVLDINGWDIRKALKLFYKSNVPLYEWLQSPVIYREKADFRKGLLNLMEEYYSPKSACHHYLSMAYNTWVNEMQGTEVRLKKYFYVLRPLLACQWILQGRGVAPMEFHILRTLIKEESIQKIIDQLLEIKASADEKTLCQINPEMMTWLEKEIELSRSQISQLTDRSIPDYVKLDEVFRQYIEL